MSKYRKKPVVVEAMQFTGSSTSVNLVESWMSSGVEPSPSFMSTQDLGRVINIETLEGIMEATMGDWIIKGVNGEFYPCKPDIFAATYERVEE